MMTTEKSPFEIGKINIVWAPEKGEESEVVVFATGPLLHNALMAAQELAKKIPVTVVNVHTIKPLDAEAIVKLAKKSGAVVTVEEHQAAGGLGSAVAEVLAASYAVPIECIAVHDQFGQSGEPAELIKHYHLDTPSIVAAILRAKKRRIK